MEVLYFILYMTIRNPVVPYPDGAGVAKPIVRAAHIYHGLDSHRNGVQFSIEDPDGTQYFRRGGRYCTLLNKKFMKRWANK